MPRDLTFSAVRGHQRTVEFLRQTMRADRLAHAWIFTGPAGIGKSAIAFAFAAWLQCEADGDEACGSCPSCRQVSAGSHPDVRWVSVETGKREIGVDRARDLKKFSQLAPLRGRSKIAIVDAADRLSIAAQNALLKTLEDPPGRSLLLLVTDNADMLLATIRSRCQRLAFAPLSASDVAAILTASHGIEPGVAARLAALAEGSPGRALELQASLGDQGSLLAALREVQAGRYVDLDRFAQRLNQPESELGTKLEVLLAEMRDEAIALARSGAAAKPALRRLLDQSEHIATAATAVRRGSPNRQLLLDALLLRLATPGL